MYFSWRQVLWADYARIQLLCFFTKFCISFIRAYEEFGSPGSCDESVICCTWLPGVECAASWHEHFAYASLIGGWSVALMLRTELFICFYAKKRNFMKKR
jgi:hypothetical protein